MQMLANIYNQLIRWRDPAARPTSNLGVALEVNHSQPELLDPSTTHWQNRCRLRSVAVANTTSAQVLIDETGPGVLQALALGWADPNNSGPPQPGWDAVVTLEIDGYTWTQTIPYAQRYYIAVGFDGGSRGIVLPDAVRFYAKLKLTVGVNYTPNEFKVFAAYRKAA